MASTPSRLPYTPHDASRSEEGAVSASARSLRDRLDAGSLAWTEAQARDWWDVVAKARSHEPAESARGTTVLAVAVRRRAEPA